MALALVGWLMLVQWLNIMLMLTFSWNIQEGYSISISGMTDAGSVVEHYIDTDFQVEYPGRVWH